MPIATQAKLLRVIEESKVRRLGGANDLSVSVRVLAATNRPPDKAIQNKQLREDLFYRLNVFHISLPPLRDRRSDIPAIASALIRDLNRKHGCKVTHLDPDVLKRLESNDWPGNVRQLRNVIERSVIVAGEGEIQLRHLPAAFVPRPPAPEAATDDMLQMHFGAPMSEVQEAYIRLALKHTKGNRRRAAEILGLSLRTLHNKLRSYEAEASEGRSQSDEPGLAARKTTS
jgi:DNA-binding NtrC family response regulator